MLMTVQHGIVSLQPNERSSGLETVQISTNILLIRVVPWHFDMFTLSCKVEEPSKAPLHEIFCYAADQTARNKWLAVFRRMVVTIVATNLPSLLLSSGSCSDLDSLRQQGEGTLRRSVSFDDFSEGHARDYTTPDGCGCGSCINVIHGNQNVRCRHK